jgi:hypothetical protein
VKKLTVAVAAIIMMGCLGCSRTVKDDQKVLNDILGLQNLVLNPSVYGPNGDNIEVSGETLGISWILFRQHGHTSLLLQKSFHAGYEYNNGVVSHPLSWDTIVVYLYTEDHRPIDNDNGYIGIQIGKECLTQTAGRCNVWGKGPRQTEAMLKIEADGTLEGFYQWSNDVVRKFEGVAMQKWMTGKFI